MDPENISIDIQMEQATEMGMVVASEAMQKVVKQLNQVAKFRFYPVLLTGETGVGKQEAALHLHRMTEIIHARSRENKSGQFVDIHCGALAQNLLESELFGHVRGAFTGGISDKQGQLEVAQGGTLFLDEIGDANPGVQKRLLKFLDTGEIVTVSSVKKKIIRTRDVTATHRDLQALVYKGRFREDLYQRFNTFPICIPPLRERLNDIEPLVANCIERFNDMYGTRFESGLSHRVITKIQGHDWPGNIRELFNVIERSLIHKGKGELRPEDIIFANESSEISDIAKDRQPSQGQDDIKIGGPYTLRQVRKAHIIGVLQSCNYHKSNATKILGIPRSALYRALERNRILIKKNSSINETRVMDEETPGIDKPDPVAEKLGLLPKNRSIIKIDN